MTTSTLTEVRATDIATFIRDHATPQDLEVLRELRRLRREVQWTVQGSLVREGSIVEIHNMRPNYLNGLIGTVTSTGKSHKGETIASLRLEPASAARLAKARRNATDHLDGIPLSSLTPRT
ncbi:hypothetical protein ACIQU4_28580 [Streptomyces sp. NPDC090741]|uniref:hypothetical protein n=1 Tax=Streptomyces sp. NPDC090741 TaxID=3365967 RepID=UPI003813D4AB